MSTIADDLERLVRSAKPSDSVHMSVSQVRAVVAMLRKNEQSEGESSTCEVLAAQRDLAVKNMREREEKVGRLRGFIVDRMDFDPGNGPQENGEMQAYQDVLEEIDRLWPALATPATENES